MRVWRHTEWIARTPERVFDFFFEYEHAPRWRGFVKSMAPIDAGPPRAGTRLRVSLDLMGEEHELELTLTALERPVLWRHHTNEVDFRGEIEYRLESERGGTRVTMTGSARPVTLYGWLAVPLLWLSRGRAYREQLPRLKAVLESL
jgi:hypothetical protein